MYSPSVASKSLTKQLSNTAAVWTGTRMFGTISLFRAVKLYSMKWGRTSTSEYPLLPLGMALCLPKGPHNHSCSWSLDYHCQRLVSWLYNKQLGRSGAYPAVKWITFQHICFLHIWSFIAYIYIYICLHRVSQPTSVWMWCPAIQDTGVV